jgi:hypothetical protein
MARESVQHRNRSERGDNFNSAFRKRVLFFRGAAGANTEDERAGALEAADAAGLLEQPVKTSARQRIMQMTIFLFLSISGSSHFYLLSITQSSG